MNLNSSVLIGQSETRMHCSHLLKFHHWCQVLGSEKSLRGVSQMIVHFALVLFSDSNGVYLLHIYQQETPNSIN